MRQLLFFVVVDDAGREQCTRAMPGRRSRLPAGHVRHRLRIPTITVAPLLDIDAVVQDHGAVFVKNPNTSVFVTVTGSGADGGAPVLPDGGVSTSGYLVAPLTLVNFGSDGRGVRRGLRRVDPALPRRQHGHRLGGPGRPARGSTARPSLSGWIQLQRCALSDGGATSDGGVPTDGRERRRHDADGGVVTDGGGGAWHAARRRGAERRRGPGRRRGRFRGLLDHLQWTPVVLRHGAHGDARARLDAAGSRTLID